MENSVSATLGIRRWIAFLIATFFVAAGIAVTPTGANAANNDAPTYELVLQRENGGSSNIADYKASYTDPISGKVVDLPFPENYSSELKYKLPAGTKVLFTYTTFPASQTNNLVVKTLGNGTGMSLEITKSNDDGSRVFQGTLTMDEDKFATQYVISLGYIRYSAAGWMNDGTNTRVVCSPIYGGLSYDGPNKVPTRKNYTFAGWSLDPEGKKPVKFPIEKVTGNLNFYAQWTPYPTLSFDTNGGSAIDSQSVAPNTTGVQPDAPKLAHNHFVGWYVDPDLTTPFDFTTPITKDTVVYAKWEKVSNDTTTDEEPIPFETEVTHDNTIPAGEIRTLVEGVPGKVTYTAVLNEAGEPVLEKKVTAPTTRKLVVGTMTQGKVTNTADVDIEFNTEIRYNDQLPAGQSKTIVEGEKGTQRVTISQGVTNSAPEGEANTNTEVIKPAVNRVIEIGTKCEVCAPSTASGTNSNGAGGSAPNGTKPAGDPAGDPASDSSSNGPALARTGADTYSAGILALLFLTVGGTLAAAQRKMNS